MLHEEVFLRLSREQAGWLKKIYVEKIHASKPEEIDADIELYMEIKHAIEYYDAEHEKAAKNVENGVES